MNSDSEKQACTRRCWWMGAGAGLILAFLLLAFGDWRFFGAVFIGIIVAGVVGFLLNMFLCADADTQDTASAPRSEAAGAADASTSMAAGAGAAVAAPGRPAAKPANVGTTTPTEFVSETPEAGDVAQAKTGTPKPAVPASTAPKTTASKTTASKEMAPKTAPKTAAAKTKPKATAAKTATPKPKTAAAPKAPAPTTAKAPKQPSAPAESAPDVLSAPRAGGADDFKLIDGVGPKLEQTLNELGFYHFDQMANWGKDEIAWVDARLRFKGRIERDGWVAQAKTLAQKT